ncbi:MFS transporter [Rhodocytophaga aerolata]|uniref:MFS transporter n=1 Tax=Rhodocytophaga aerolata TaxID=455078 RepID=A0ABT8R3B1_9BACT|nr:MFS transporter [Rhodocytophaga aerolata]MDO1446580.1 MFS transporter [Rhodocytophaga aerolata]
MTSIIRLYRNAYGGLSTPSWMLALVMFINRSGSMVVPFLSVYLTGSLKFTIEQAGIILTAFGIGSMAGALLGGWLSDKLSPFLVQVLSLVAGGCLFLVLAHITTYYLLLAGILLLSVISECLRPANSASIALYARPENVTRSFSLNRMAINLGFSIGPAIGGLLASISYYWIFIADGLTCIVAGLFFYLYFRQLPARQSTPAVQQSVSEKSPYLDIPFLLFLVFVTCYAISFTQFFFTLPLYYREVYHLSEIQIGLLLGFNGLLVFLFEMIIVHRLERKTIIWHQVVLGTLLCGFSFVLLNLFSAPVILIIAMVLLTFSEIFAMPFMVTYTVKRAGERNRGSYLGLYSMAFAAAFILAPFLGTKVISYAGFATLWWSAGVLSLFTAGGFYLTMNEKKVTEPLKLPSN